MEKKDLKKVQVPKEGGGLYLLRVHWVGVYLIP